MNSGRGKKVVGKLKVLFEEHANPAYAFDMKKYMKNRFDFFGIKTPVRKELLKPIMKEVIPSDFGNLSEIIVECWKQPEREYQYFAMALIEKHLTLVDHDDYHIYHHMITNKSWWDTVDMISSHGVGEHLIRFPDLRDELHQQWLFSENMWLQRTMILHQLKYKFRTDPDRLKANILHCRASDEFFIQKAIGWALREYSKTDAAWVEDFIKTNDLKPLSRREGLKWLRRS